MAIIHGDLEDHIVVIFRVGSWLCNCQKMHVYCHILLGIFQGWSWLCTCECMKLMSVDIGHDFQGMSISGLILVSAIVANWKGSLAMFVRTSQHISWMLWHMTREECGKLLYARQNHVMHDVWWPLTSSHFGLQVCALQRWATYPVTSLLWWQRCLMMDWLGLTLTSLQVAKKQNCRCTKIKHCFHCQWQD